MLGKEMIIKQFNYSYWANERILEKATAVTPEQFMAKQGVEQRSLHETLFHTLQTEWVWRHLSQDGKLDPAQMPRIVAYPTPQALQAGATAEAEKMRAYLNSLNDDTLCEVVPTTRWDGKKVSLTRWHMLIHLNLHCMQHRSEAATILTNYGQSPGDLDFIFVSTKL